MENFHQFWDKINKINGEIYKDIPPPVKYDFANYMDAISNGSPLNNGENGSWDLSPLSKEDMATTSSQDALDWQQKFGTNTTKLGKPMTDDELNRFRGNPH